MSNQAFDVAFDQFFEEVWGFGPFPWQKRLAERVADGGWPRVLDLPTGAGKTAALDVALFDFVRDAGRRAPRRIVLVVDRRIIVDQVAERARRLREALEKPSGPATQAVAERLRAIVDEGLPREARGTVPMLETAVLRGATIRDDAWAHYPHVPVLGASTVDQVGSRLLFRGYGVSHGAQPIHAGLMGCDTLLLLDEVHLARPFAQLLDQLRRLREGFGYEELIPRRFAFVEMSATPDAEGEEPPFALEEEDRAHPVLAQRLGASKPTRLVRVNVSGVESARREKLAKRAAKEAKQMVTAGKRAVAVVVNRVETARLTATALEGESSFDVRLLTGRMRPLDQAELLEDIRDRVMAGRSESDDRPLVLVATQCIEAGADFDFDGLVTQSAALDALRQRFGRLDRRGGRGAEAVILHRSDQDKGGDPVYGDALANTWAWLHELAEATGDLDFGIDALDRHLPQDQMSSLRRGGPTAGVILPAYLDRWAQTRPKPSHEPDVSLYLHGLLEDGERPADVQVVWREGLLHADDTGHPQEQAEVQESLRAVPPGALETMSLPPWSVRAWLAHRESTDLADVEGQVVADGARKDEDEEQLRAFLVLGDEGWRWAQDEGALRPGALVVVPAEYGGLGIGGTFDPRAERLVTDLGDVTQLRQRGRPTLRLSQRLLGGCMTGHHLVGLSDDEHPAEVLEAALADIMAKPPEGATPGERLVLRALEPKWRLMPVTPPTEAHGGTWLAAGPILGPRDLRTLLQRACATFDDALPDDASTEAEDEAGSLVGTSVPLTRHLRGVQGWASRFAKGVGLSQSFEATLRWAGFVHDLGKADPRFQLLLHGGDPVAAVRAENEGLLLAKSATPWFDRAALRRARARAGYPQGQRHELVSLAMVQNNVELRTRVEAEGGDWELLLHLVASHHGWCRPWPPVLDATGLEDEHAETELEGIAFKGPTRHGGDELGSGVALRFHRLNRRYGWHELAYLESLLRLADMRRSAWEQEHGVEEAE